MRFLVDAQLPPALARSLVAAGHNAEHVGDVSLRDAEDDVIWLNAASSGAVIVSKDEDFADRHRLDPAGPPVVWLRVGNCSKRALLAWFTPLLPYIVARLEAGDRLVEVI